MKASGCCARRQSGGRITPRPGRTWQRRRAQKHDVDALRDLARSKPELEAAHAQLGKALYERGQFEEAIEPLQKAIELDPNYGLALTAFGATMARLNRNDEAVALFKRSLAITPEDASLHMNLGSALYQKHDLDAAIAAFHESLRLDPNNGFALASLAYAQHAKGEAIQAIASIEKATRVDPKNADHHYWLGSFLEDQNRFHEAIAAYRAAVKIRGDFPMARSHLSIALFYDHQPEEAVRTCRETVRLYPDQADAQYNLGTLLMLTANSDDAIKALREAIRLDPDHPEANCNLGKALEQKGRFAEALDHFRRGHQAGTKRGNWNYPSAQWIADCEHLLAMESLLNDVLKGTKQPRNSVERIELARVANLRGRHAESVKLAAEAVAKEPAAADPGKSPIRHYAAACAALAGAGEGREKQAIDEKLTASWRNQAFEWLQADLTFWNKQIETGRADKYLAIKQNLERWKIDSDLAGIRDQKALERLSEDERKKFQAFWDEVNKALGRVLARQ